MKKLVFILVLLYQPFLLALDQSLDVKQLSNTLHAKLAYYTDFHQETYRLLSNREILVDDRATWEQYLHSALISENYSQALVKIKNSADNFPKDLRTFYFIFCFLGNKKEHYLPHDRLLEWESSFELIPLNKQAHFLNKFYSSDLVDYARSRHFMMRILTMLGYDIKARELLFRPLDSHDSYYISQISNLFSPKVLSVYFERLVEQKTLKKSVDYKPLLLNAEASFKYSIKAQEVISEQFSSLSDFYLLADKSAWSLFEISSNQKSQKIKAQLEIVKSIFSLNYDQAYQYLQKQKDTLLVDDYIFLYSLLIHQSEHKVEYENPLIDLSTINLAYEDKIKEFRFKYLVSHEPDRALYRIHKSQMFDNWEDEVFWEAKIHANNSHYERALEMLNNLIRIKPLDLDTRYLLSQILIDHYEQYDLAEKLLNLNLERSPKKLSLLASIATAKGDRAKALELVHELFEEDVSISIARRALSILELYDQYEFLERYKVKVVENYPAPWREQIKKEMDR